MDKYTVKQLFIRLCACLFFILTPAAYSATLTFEGGGDGVKISTSEPGVQFSTTQGYDWIYGVWSTGNYNGPYPSGAYYSFGDTFAWLGPNQGLGRIDFDLDVAKSVTTRYSSYSTVKLEAFDASGNLLVADSGSGNLNTGGMGTLTVEAPNIAYVFVHDSGNYWLIDDFASELNEVSVLSVDLQATQNKTDHNTDDYDPTVVRRGATISVNVLVTTGFDPAYYDLNLLITDATGAEFITEPGALDAQIWRADMGTPMPKSWLPFFEFDDYLVVPFELHIPYDLPIGEFDIAGRLQRKGGVGTPEVVPAEEPLYVIFNPWSPQDDDVYSSLTTAELAEYVLNDSGDLYRMQYAKPWAYEQFDDAVFLTTLDILASMPYAQRGSAANVARHLSAMANVQDDNGVLVGNWSGNFSGGTAPGDWSSSEAILSAYRSAGPVRYGQCWVFSGVVNSMGRTLGLPTRSITNIGSAHDTVPLDGIINLYTNANEIPAALITSGAVPRPESIWNFHVWNEVMLNFRGMQWQAIDGTPQELSAGLYRMGPAPISAVYANAGGNYDVSFVHNEVQATVRNYYFNTATNTAVLLSEDQYRSDDMYTDTETGQGQRLPAYCDDCSASVDHTGFTDRAKQSVAMVLRSLVGLLVPMANAAPGDGAANGHQPVIQLSGPVNVGGHAAGDVVIESRLATADTVTVILSVKAKAQNGSTYHTFHNEVFSGQPIGANGSLTLPFDVAIGYVDGMQFGVDSIDIEVVVLGESGNGFAHKKQTLLGPSPVLELLPVDGRSSYELKAHLHNSLSLALADLQLQLNVPPGVSVLSPLVQNVASILPGETATASWTISVSESEARLEVVSHFSDNTHTSAWIRVQPAPAPALALSFAERPPLALGETGDLVLSVSNRGGAAAGPVEVLVNAASELGGFAGSLGVMSIGEGETVPLRIPLSASQTGVFPVVAYTGSGELRATALVSVKSVELGLQLSLERVDIPADFSGSVAISLQTDAVGAQPVTVSAIAANANTHYGIYDGVTRVLSEQVMVPASGKALSLRVNETGGGGWIRVTARAVNDPSASASATLKIGDGGFQSNVDNRVATTLSGMQYDRRSGSYRQPVQIQNTSSGALLGPVWLVLSDLAPEQVSVANASGRLADGRVYVQLLDNSTSWLPGETLDMTILLKAPGRERVSFDTQVLAVVPNN